MNIEQIAEVEVGKFYNVPCAIMRRSDKLVRYIPIIGIAHADPQFGAHQEHYHIDGRFSKISSIDSEGKTNRVIWTKETYGYEEFKGVKIMRKKCLRTTTGIKPPPHAESYFKWYAGFVGRSCKGRKCPHLGATMIECGDKIVCPLHGLTANKVDEIILPNEQAAALEKQFSEIFR